MIIEGVPSVELSRIDSYRFLLRQSLSARQEGDEDREDFLLEQMDALWRTMKDVERGVARAFTAYLSKACLNERGDVVRSPAREEAGVSTRTEAQLVSQSMLLNFSRSSSQTLTLPFALR
jgi:hypothetical protein